MAVLVYGNFGRRPRIGDVTPDGRGHWPGARVLYTQRRRYYIRQTSRPYVSVAHSGPTRQSLVRSFPWREAVIS